MKKILSLLCAVILAVSVVGCGGNAQEAVSIPDESIPEADVNPDTDMGSSSEGENEPIETSNGEFETEEIKLIDDLYDTDTELIDTIQGNITNIDNGGTFPVLIADNKVYADNYGTLKEFLTLPAEPDDIIYFSNSSIGENLLYFKDGKLSLFPFNGYGIQFTNIDFAAATDFVGEIGTSSYFNIVRQDDTGYVIEYYENNGEGSEFSLESQKPLKSVETPDVEGLTVKQIVPLKSNNNSYSVYVLTDNNDIYALDGVNSDGSMTVLTSEPIASGVELIIAPSDISTYLTTPLYSKMGDNTALYSEVSGASLIDTSDNFEVTFVLPDDHTPSEVADVFRVSDKLVFVFSNGDTYFTDDIEKDGQSAYEMTKLEEVSKLNADGTILDMAGASTFDNNLYILMSDGKLYYEPLE